MLLVVYGHNSLRPLTVSSNNTCPPSGPTLNLSALYPPPATAVAVGKYPLLVFAPAFGPGTCVVPVAPVFQPALADWKVGVTREPRFMGKGAHDCVFRARTIRSIAIADVYAAGRHQVDAVIIESATVAAEAVDVNPLNRDLFTLRDLNGPGR